MLLKYNGFFLADVVCLGKTVVASMIAKRFIEENGIRDSRVLVIYPPALANNWKDTFDKFKISRNTDFISCGSLDKILNGDASRAAEEYDLVLVGETHRFRGDGSQMYDSLQWICKTDRDYIGRIGDRQKKVMLTLNCGARKWCVARTEASQRAVSTSRSSGRGCSNFLIAGGCMG